MPILPSSNDVLCHHARNVGRDVNFRKFQLTRRRFGSFLNILAVRGNLTLGLQPREKKNRDILVGYVATEAFGIILVETKQNKTK